MYQAGMAVMSLPLLASQGRIAAVYEAVMQNAKDL
jgi:hypothetical protein